jgi:DNA-binding CsgD family transcriptional regulator
MLMIIMHVCNIRAKKWLTGTLLILAFVVFLVAASPGILPIYYKEVSYAVVDGAAKLIKVYGPLHPLYLVYLLGYFGTMVAVILRASAKKAIDSTAHVVVLAIAVLVNICVWFIEQISPIDFEFLSVSYIISELFLLGVHMVVKETEHLKLLLQQKDSALQAAQAALPEQTDGETKALFLKGLKTLTPTEKTVFEAYIRGDGTKQVMETMGITENTLKFHNKNLYSKLGVSSRKQMLTVYHDIEKVSQMGGQ